MSQNGVAVSVRLLPGGICPPSACYHRGRTSLSRHAARMRGAESAAAPPLLAAARLLRRVPPPQQALARRPLRCSARLTSSRDSLDEEFLEQQTQQQAVQNGRMRVPAAVPGAVQQQAQEQRPRLDWQQSQQAQQQAMRYKQQDQQQQRRQQQARDEDEGWPAEQLQRRPPRQLSVQDLQKLTELHVGDAYAVGVVESGAELAECLGTDLRDGLKESQEELAARAMRYGRNVVRPPREVTFWQLVQEALQDFTILTLLGAGCVSLGLEFAVNSTNGEGSWIEGASILAAVCVVVLVTAVNNYQKERQFRMLQAVSEDVKVRAIRNGREQAVQVQDVLVGDLLLVEAGDILCTDGLLVDGCDVKVDESHLTGESDDVSKDPFSRPSLLGGSKILSGFGRMLVTAVGPNSQSGAIAEMVADGKAAGALATGSRNGGTAPGISSVGAKVDNASASSSASSGGVDGLREETLLQQKLAEYATFIGRFGLGAAGLAFAAMTLRFSYDTFVVQGAAWDWAFLQDYLHFFITGVTILVVAVPEGLPLAVTLALAFSVRRMLADNNLVRHLSAAETMGTATVVCSDKTGTLTQNDMVVSRLWLAGNLLPDLKPYTRRGEAGRQQGTGAAGAGGASDSGKQGLASQALAARNSSTSSTGGTNTTSTTAGRGSALGSMAGGQQALPPLTELVRSSLASMGGSSSSELYCEESRSSILDSITAGSAAPADVVQLLVESIALNSTANIYSDKDGQERRTGNRTEVALLDLARLLGAAPRAMRRQQLQLAQVPFSSERKRMTTASLPPGHDPNAEVHLCRVYTKGASEIVLERCSYVLGPDGTRRRLGEEEKARIMRDFCSGGQRVLCLAFRDVTLPADAILPASALRTTAGSDSEGSSSSSSNGSSSPAFPRPLRPSGGSLASMAGGAGEWVWDAGSLNAAQSSDSDDAATAWDESLCLADNLESGLTLLAMVGIEDPLRQEVPAAIQQCQASGITVKMLTGDNVATATSIARECGILPPAGASLAEWAAAREAGAAKKLPGGGWFAERAVGSSSSSSSSSMEAGKPVGLSAQDRSATSASGGATSTSGGAMSAASSAAVALASAGSAGAAASVCSEDSTGLGALPEGVVMEGPEFRRRVLNEDGSINADEFLALWPRLRVLARCSPADKYTIVTGVRSLTRDVVAVTGDGTNDAPALRAANVGFAMNAGTDTAKEAADIVLLDNNFASIVSAVLWGRNVYANITRFLQFQLTINLVAVATAVTGAVVASESPLTAVQMLWVNLIMDSLASLALATEPPDARMLAIPPFSQEHEFIDPRTPTVKHIVGQALYQLGVLYGLIFYAPALMGIPDHSAVVGPSEHYTLVFNTFVFMQLFNQMNARKILDSSGTWEGLSSARWFQGILGGELLLQILIVQFGGSWFNTHPLDGKEWAVCVGLGATTLLLREALRRFPYGRPQPSDS